MFDILQILPYPSPHLHMAISNDGAKFQVHLIHPLYSPAQTLQLHVVAVGHFIFLEGNFWTN